MDAPSLNVLVANGDVPPPDRDAASLRLYRIIERLAADGHRITVVGRAGFGQESISARLLALGVEHVYPIDAERFQATRPPGAQPLPIPRLPLEQILANGQFDVAWLSLCDVAEQYLPLLRTLSPATRVIVDSADIWWIREHRAALLSGDDRALAAAHRTRERERRVYGAADVNVAISEHDAQATRELAPGVPVHVVSMMQPFESVELDPAGRDGLVFVGNFRHAPNVDAIVEFHSKTWPIVRDAIPGAHLTIVGTDPPDSVRALAGADVEITGWVERIEPYLRAARVSIAPLRYGAGVKGKIVEAIAAGLPVVSTAIGVEGMELRDGEDVLVADDATGFAAAIVALHRNDRLWRAVAASALARARERLGAAKAHEGIRAALAQAAPPRLQARADDERLGELLARFAAEHPAGDPATLVLTFAAGDDAAQQKAVDRVVALAAERRIDLDAIADVELTAWDERLPVPSRSLQAPREHRRHRPHAAVVVEAAPDAHALSAQLQALKEALPDDGVELVIVAFGHSADTAPLLDASGARVVRCDTNPGRARSTELGLTASRAPMLIQLGPLALPEPGFVEPLLSAIHDGASFAGAVAEGTHGLRIGADGSLWPLHERGAQIGALPFDCLAATRETWATAPRSLPMRDGHPERQLADWARSRGALIVPEAARVSRLRCGPVSVIVCSRNRADELGDVVALLLASKATAHGGEIVIVDNGSTDATPELAAALAAANPGVRVVNEERAGLSHARNAGAAAARNEMIAYLDDDARPAPGWIESIGWGLSRPGVASAGGPLAGLWPASRRGDFPPAGLEGAFGILDCSDGVRALVPPEIIFGGNWGIRREALRAAGGFDGHLGYSPEVRIGSEEVAVAWRLHLRGIGQTLYVPGAAAGHRIRADKVNDGFIVARMLEVGIEHAHLRAEREGSGAQRLTAQAASAAAQLLGLLPLAGELTLEQALERIQLAHNLPTRERTICSEALGLLAATVLQLGEHELLAGGMRLHLRDEHLRGVLTPSAASKERAA